ncbi:PNPOx family protein [Litchfieldia salsa]|uniref:Pyridoxamine 5'-phosphate oxidase n=1 Tax=Litchfieldia salsa TaxID=930152 RepID=A0A1H0TD16_9BACI|nr:pyridoxamine 5'-phosphate oxidase family protein [Litchfieldia salsa]SDP51907.1 Pyridoxamine 5'-phosphate oxidase [Litchfieldia salsa]
MSKTNQDKLSQELVDLLQGEKIVSLVTMDAETNKPHLSIVSWLVAHPGGEVIKFALGHKGTSVSNIQQNPEITLGVTGAGSCFSIKGQATVSDIIEKTMKYRVVTVQVESVEDIIFYGGKVTVEPDYVKTYNEDLAKKLDAEVYEMLNEK